LSASGSPKWLRLDGELLLLDPVSWETHLLPAASADLFLDLIESAPHEASDLEARLDLLSPDMADADKRCWIALLTRAGAVVRR
jgi:hypothetical protein